MKRDENIKHILNRIKYLREAGATSAEIAGIFNEDGESTLEILQGEWYRSSVYNFLSKYGDSEKR